MYVLEGILRGGKKKTPIDSSKLSGFFLLDHFQTAFTRRPRLLALCLTVRLFALCSSPPPSWRVVEEAVVLCAEVKHFAKGLPAAHSHCTAGEAKPTFRASPRFIFGFFFLYAAKLLLSVWTIKPAAAHRVRLHFFLLLQQLNAWWEVRGVTTTS